MNKMVSVFIRSYEYLHTFCGGGVVLAIVVDLSLIILDSGTQKERENEIWNGLSKVIFPTIKTYLHNNYMLYNYCSADAHDFWLNM